MDITNAKGGRGVTDGDACHTPFLLSLTLCEFSCSFLTRGAFCFYFYKRAEWAACRRSHSQLLQAWAWSTKNQDNTNQRSSFLIKMLLLKYCGHLAHLHPPISSLPPQRPPRTPAKAATAPPTPPFVLVQINIFIFIVSAWTVLDRRSQRAVITRNCC